LSKYSTIIPNPSHYQIHRCGLFKIHTLFYDIAINYNLQLDVCYCGQF